MLLLYSGRSRIGTKIEEAFSYDLIVHEVRCSLCIELELGSTMSSR